MKKLLVAIISMLLHTFSVSAIFANDSYSPLFEAIYEGDLNKVKELIAAGADVNEHWRGTTPLMVSVGRFDRTYDIVKELVENGANINEIFDSYVTEDCNVFFRTINYHSIRILQLLVDSGGNINIQNKYTGTTPLIYAINYQRSMGDPPMQPVIKKLVDFGADVNLQDKYGYTPILHAVYNQSGEFKEILKTLLDAGADINAKNPDMYKTKGGLRFDKGATPFLIAAGYCVATGYSGFEDCINILLSYDTQINAKDSKGRNAILYSMYSTGMVTSYNIEYMIETINKLLSLKLDINDKDIFGRTAMHYACFTKNTYTPRDPNQKDASSNPLIKMLLDSGADINAQDNDGKTALMLAAEDDKADTVSYLLELGANPHIKDKNGKTALDLAREQKAVDAFWALKSYYQ